MDAHNPFDFSIFWTTCIATTPGTTAVLITTTTSNTTNTANATAATVVIAVITGTILFQFDSQN